MTRSVLLSTMSLQMKQSFVRPMFQFCLLVNPVLSTILLYEMFRNSGQKDFASYVILGAGLMALWGCICFSSVGDINRERYSGTLGLIFAAPAGFQTIILGKILGNTFLSLGALLISMGTAALVYRSPLILESPGYFLIALFGTAGSFAVVSIAIAYLLTLSRRTTLYMNCLEIPFILLCGMAFPVEVLPSWLQIISRCLAPTWAVELLRMAVDGVEDCAVFWRNFTVLFVLSMAMSFLSWQLSCAVDRAVRVQASLEVF